MRGSALPSAKAERERANLECVGGLRNPNQAVSRSPALQEAGRRIRGVLENLMLDTQVRREALKAADSIGKEDYAGIPAETVRKAQDAFQIAFQTADEQNLGVGRSAFPSNIWKPFSRKRETQKST